MLGDSTSLAGLKKQLSDSVPLNMLEKKLKERDEAHAKVSEERHLETVRLAEEVERLRKAEKQRMSEVETLRKNGEDLRLKLAEAVAAHDETAKAAKERELAHEQLVSGLVAEVEHVNELILGKWPPLFLCLNCGFFFLTLPA